MPWLNTPQHRQTTFIEPLYPRGGLLGGSGAPPKMSKLQELAALRKKKAEEQKAAQKNKESATQPVSDAAQRLSKLSVSSRAKQGEVASAPSTATSASAAAKLPVDPTVTTVPSKRKTDDIVQLDGPPAKSPAKSAGSHLEEAAPIEPAAPSEFAQALLGSAPSAHAPRTFALPYMAFTSSVADAFSGPSPDDVVLTAQAKGSLLGAKKA